MVGEAIVIVGLAGLLAAKGKSLYAAIVARLKGEVTVAASKGTAFARLAEQEGKVVALKAANAAKNAEAKAIHAGLDEFDKMIG